MTEQFQESAHNKSNLQVHLIWAPKYRKKILTGDIAIRLRAILRDICAEYNIKIISGKIGKDYVHMLIRYKPDQSISQIVGRLKGKSAIMLFQEFDHLRNVLWGGHLWARGYCALTPGNFSEKIAQDYIQQTNE